jgi:hypothetical protein
MAIQLPCPRCRQALFIEADSAGQIVKCPGCLVEFAIPGADGPPVAAMVATPVTASETVTVGDVQRAELNAQQAAARHLPAHIELVESNRRRQRLAARLATLNLFRSGRRWLDHSVTRIGGFCIGITLGGSFFVLLSNLFSPSAIGYFLAALVGIVVSALAYMPFSFLPQDEALEQMIGPLGARLQEASATCQRCQVEESRLSGELAVAQTEHARLLEIIESRKQWLLTCQWPVMTGATFEAFLAEVFKELGYTVVPTGKTGDQGVDLIITRNGSRTAVQAKGYVGQIVGNAAVQQVHAGKGFYGCQGAVVITNSSYTSSAKELAAKLHCQLIDGSQIPDLIDGRILV